MKVLRFHVKIINLGPMVLLRTTLNKYKEVDIPEWIMIVGIDNPE